jgi:hypothetical protein
VLHRDEESTFEVRYHEDGRFIWYLLTLNERAENDPELLRAAAPDAREIPFWPSLDPDESFPTALRPELARIAEIHLQHREGRTPKAVVEDAENAYADVRDRVDALSR